MELVQSIIYAVAEREDADPMDLPRLIEDVDPTALQALVESADDATTTVTFTYCGYRIFVDGTGNVEIDG